VHITLSINGHGVYHLPHEFDSGDVEAIRKNPEATAIGILNHLIDMHKNEDDDTGTVIDTHAGAKVSFADMNSIDLDIDGKLTHVSMENLRWYMDQTQSYATHRRGHEQAGYLSGGYFGMLDDDQVDQIRRSFTGIFAKDLPRCNPFKTSTPVSQSQTAWQEATVPVAVRQRQQPASQSSAREAEEHFWDPEQAAS
jgi:hypothetical protein